MNTAFALDADTLVILAGAAVAIAMGYLGWRLIRAGRRPLGGLAWLIAALAAIIAYFFATFSIRLM